jgi:hypothetical protein
MPQASNDRPVKVATEAPRGAHADAWIWAYAFGYFACYAPYSALTKLVSRGALAGMTHRVDGFALLPPTTLVSFVTMLVFLGASGWWRRASRRPVFGFNVLVPTRWTLLSGLATAAIIGSTTLAYTISGTSIVFMMLLMRGGVLAIAPVVDLAGKRRVQTTSWIALALSLFGLAITLQDGANYALSTLGIVDVAVYLSAYFIRLRVMSHVAKSEDRNASIQYFVEEQLVATPAIIGFLALVAMFGKSAIAHQVHDGFTGIIGSGSELYAMIIGILSQGTGVFGALVLLDGRENAFCVPVNRAASILAGVLATATLAWLKLEHSLPASELWGAACVLAAIVVLGLPRRAPRK